jgi:hypothetical protein
MSACCWTTSAWSRSSITRSVPAQLRSAGGSRCCQSVLVVGSSRCDVLRTSVHPNVCGIGFGARRSAAQADDDARRVPHGARGRCRGREIPGESISRVLLIPDLRYSRGTRAHATLRRSPQRTAEDDGRTRCRICLTAAVVVGRARFGSGNLLRLWAVYA